MLILTVILLTVLVVGVSGLSIYALGRLGDLEAEVILSFGLDL